MRTLFSATVLLFLFQTTVFSQSDIDMSPHMKKQLNVFFSNFAESNFPSFKKGELTDALLMHFAIWHCTFHLLDTLKKSKDGSSALADAALIDALCEKYFGTKPSKHESRIYTIDLASGEGRVFSQVDKLTAVAHDAYAAHGTLYYTGSGVALDPHAAPGVWKKQKKDVRVYGTFTGCIRKTGPDKDGYILEEYAVKLK